MWTVPLGGSTCVIGSSLNLGRLPVSSFKAPLHDPSPKSFSSGLCRASQVAELLPTISPEVYVREARVEDCWDVAETHCSSFFPEYSFPLDFVLRIDRLIAMLFGFSIPNGCQRTCLVAVVGSRDEEACLLGTEELKLGGFDGRLSLNKGYVTGILTVDTVADFLPRKGPLRKRRSDGIFTVYEHEDIVTNDIDQQMAQSNNVGSSSRSSNREMYAQCKEIARPMWEDYIKEKGIAYISNVAVRKRYRRKGIAKKLIMKAEAQARSWGCRAIALHCDTSNPGATKLYIGQGFRVIKVPEGANWPQPKTSPNVQFGFLMKLLDI